MSKESLKILKLILGTEKNNNIAEIKITKEDLINLVKEKEITLSLANKWLKNIKERIIDYDNVYKANNQDRKKLYSGYDENGIYILKYSDVLKFIYNGWSTDCDIFFYDFFNIEPKPYDFEDFIDIIRERNISYGWLDDADGNQYWISNDELNNPEWDYFVKEFSDTFEGVKSHPGGLDFSNVHIEDDIFGD